MTHRHSELVFLQIVLILVTPSVLGAGLLSGDVLAPLSKGEDIVAFANWPFHLPGWSGPSLLLSTDQSKALDAQYRATQRQLSQQDFVRFLRSGRLFGITNRLPDVPAESDWVNVQGVAFTKRGSVLIWQMVNAKTLSVRNLEKKACFLVIDSACQLETFSPTNILLAPPHFDQVKGFCNASPMEMAGFPLKSVKREDVLDFLSRGKPVPAKSRQPPAREFWQASGAFLAGDIIYFFDRWDERTMYLERHDGASCILLRSDSSGHTNSASAGSARERRK